MAKRASRRVVDVGPSLPTASHRQSAECGIKLWGLDNTREGGPASTRPSASGENSNTTSRQHHSTRPLIVARYPYQSFRLPATPRALTRVACQPDVLLHTCQRGPRLGGGVWLSVCLSESLWRPTPSLSSIEPSQLYGAPFQGAGSHQRDGCHRSLPLCFLLSIVLD